MNKHVELIQLAHGVVEDIFVLKPGIMITQVSSPTPEFNKLAEAISLDNNRPFYEQHAELNARITYMSFKNDKSSEGYNRDMVDTYKHLSVYNDCSVTILLAGISLEATLEITAHNEASIARLTSSKTKAQSEPLFVIEPNCDIIQKEYIKKILEIKKNYCVNDLEIDNRLYPSNKAISLTVTMSLKNWHKTLIGRLSRSGVEREMLIICENICSLLHERFPLVIKTKENYYAMNNGEKYSE